MAAAANHSGPEVSSRRIELRDVIKSPDVEDPINLHVHRPLQLALVRHLVKTSITPNQITALALCAGLASAACFFVGSKTSLVIGALLLFSSAILDGCDGMIARLKKLSSETGHAIDGAADYATNVATMAAASYHLAVTTGRPLLAVALGFGAHIACAHHIMLYDFHCATYLRFLTNGRHAGGDLERGKDLLARMKARGEGFVVTTLIGIYVWQLGNRNRFLERINPVAAGYGSIEVDGRAAAAYVARHRTTMRAWALLGNAPHMDLFALAAATDRFDLYFAGRIFLFTLLAVVLVGWERRVSRAPLLGFDEAAAA
jgi:hypothetical protein